MTPRRVQTAGYLVWHLSTKWRVAVDRALNRFGLTHAHYLVLGSLSEFSRGGAKPSQRELADFAGLEVMYVSKLVRSLEQSGLLQRADHPDDTRAFQLELTALGADLVVQAAAVMRGLFDQLLRPIGGRTGKRQIALIRTLEVLLDEADGLNRANETRTPSVSRQHPRPVRKSVTRSAR
jgi:MarR family transcriptional regulator, organic hydroperoxide resistance regulator